MNKIIPLIVIILVLFSSDNSYASNDTPSSFGEGIFMDARFTKICEKVILFLKGNPTKAHLDLEGLLNEDILSQDEYEFIKSNNIKYNPPSSAGPHDNYLSIFDRENEDGTSSHILYDLVDKSDPSITKTGTIASLYNFLDQWYAFPSDDKSMFIFNNEDFYYFTLCYYNNSHWNKQHKILIDFPEKNLKEINILKKILKDSKIECREYIAQSRLHIDVMLPSDLPTIKKICFDILKKIYIVSPNDVISYTPNGFRFKNG